MDNFERTKWGDAIYSAIGRTLTLATRFKSSCRGLASILQLIATPHGILESSTGIKELSDKLYRRSLYQNISTFAPTRDGFRHLLDEAKNARNEIAHEITLGMEDQEGNEFQPSESSAPGADTGCRGNHESCGQCMKIKAPIEAIGNRTEVTCSVLAEGKGMIGSAKAGFGVSQECVHPLKQGHLRPPTTVGRCSQPVSVTPAKPAKPSDRTMLPAHN